MKFANLANAFERRLYAISSDLAAIEGPLEACIHITSLYPYLDILWVQEQQGQVHDLQERVMPFAEELGFVLVVRRIPLVEHLFDRLVRLKFFLFALLVEQESFCVFAAETRVVQAALVKLVRLDVVVNTFEAFETLEELVILVGVMQM